MKTIRAKIRLFMTAMVNLSLLVMAAVTIVMNYRSTLNTLEQTMTRTADIAAERVQMELEGYRQIAYEVGCLSPLSDSETTISDKREIILQRVSTHGFQSGDILGTDGISLFSGKNCLAQAFYQKALQGETSVSDPVINETTGEVSFTVAAPIWEDGVPGSKVVGVVCFEPQETFLNDIVAQLKVSENGSAYILDKEGYTIAHKNMDNVRSRENTQKDAQTDSGLAELASMEHAMTQGMSGFGQYSYGGVTKFLAYTPINGTDGWSLGINAPQPDIMSFTKKSIAVTAVVLVTAIFVAVLVAGWLARGISRSVNACAGRMQTLAEGDLTTPVLESRSKDETGKMMNSIRSLTAGLNELIHDIDYLLSNMSDGNFDVRSRCEERYVGDFSGILRSIDRLSARLSDTLRSVGQAADQVSAGAGQMADSSQVMAQGSAQQASSIEELSATANEITRQVETTAGYAKTARSENLRSHEQIQVCSEHMKELVDAMHLIDDKSKEINKINKTIEDIATQTNILALNATVEAARAGAAGKGFAVVADEIRSLAGKSTEASKTTSQLIDETVRAVNEGTRLSDETAQVLQEVVDSAQKTMEAVTQIFKAANEQSDAVGQISQSIGQFSDVVQTNSATAQETAAVSEELSGQADCLTKQVRQFVLRS